METTQSNGQMTQPTTTSSNTQGAGAQGQPTQTTQPSTWTMPEKFAGKSAEDIARSYQELEKLHGSKAQQWSKYEQLDNQWKPHGGIDAYLTSYGNLYKHWQDTGGQNPQTQQQTRQSSQQSPQYQDPAQHTGGLGDYFKDWDLMTGQQQAMKLFQLNQLAMQQYGQQLATQHAAELKAAQDNFQAQQRREWDIYQKVLKYTQEHPGTDPAQVLEGMTRIAQGDVNTLMEQAYRNQYGWAEMEKQFKDQFEQWKAQYMQQQANQQLNTITDNEPQGALARRLRGNGDQTANPYLQGSRTTADRNALIDKKLLEQGITPSHF